MRISEIVDQPSWVVSLYLPRVVFELRERAMSGVMIVRLRGGDRRGVSMPWRPMRGLEVLAQAPGTFA